MNNKIKIGILYICTGNYSIFWKDFYVSAEKYFIPDAEKTYFVFTDSEKVSFEQSNKNIHRIYQTDLGWPHNTLLRFEMFLKIREQLKTMDYLFFFNANTFFLEKIEKEEFIPSGENVLTACIHPGYYDKQESQFEYERRTDSLAYIPFGRGKNYFAGGLIGGKTKDFIEAMDEMDPKIKADLEKGIIAKWFDESHWNKLLLDDEHRAKKISPSYLYIEGSNLPFPPKILLLNKLRYGSIRKLKETEKVPQGFRSRINKTNLKRFLHKMAISINLKLIFGYNKIYYFFRPLFNFVKLNKIDQDKRKISVAIANFRDKKSVYASLNNILKDDRVSEIVMVYDGTKNEDIENYIKGIKNNKVKLFHAKANIGALSSKIEAVFHCINDWVVLLDPGNTLVPSYLDSIFSIKDWAKNKMYCALSAYPIFDFKFLSERTINFGMMKKELIHNVDRSEIFLNENNCLLNRKRFVETTSKYRSFDPHDAHAIFINYVWLSNEGEIEIIPNSRYIYRTDKKNEYEKSRNLSVNMFQNIKNKFTIGLRENYDSLKEEVPINSNNYLMEKIQKTQRKRLIRRRIKATLKKIPLLQPAYQRIKMLTHIFIRYPRSFRQAVREYRQYNTESKILRGQIDQYREGTYFNFAGVKIPFYVTADSLLNVLLPHASGITYNQTETKQFFDSFKEKYSRLMYWADNIGATEPGFKNSHLISHGFTYFFEGADIEQDDIVLDIGAAPGDFSVICTARGAEKVFAFEPDTTNLKSLELTAKLNDSNISIVPLFCGNSTFGNTVTIDDFVKRENLSRVDFIKMDIEGAEVDALEGAKLTLKRFSPKLSICTYHNLGDAKKIRDLITKHNSNYKITERPGVIYAHTN